MIGLAALLTVAAAQASEPVQDMKDTGSVTIVDVTRTMDIPDEIGPAVAPYVRCLSNRTLEIQKTGRYLSDGHEVQDAIRKECTAVREEAIFMASSALERLNYRDINSRRSMVFTTLTSVEKFMLVPPETK